MMNVFNQDTALPALCRAAWGLSGNRVGPVVLNRAAWAADRLANGVPSSAESSIGEAVAFHGRVA